MRGRDNVFQIQNLARDMARRADEHPPLIDIVELMEKYKESAESGEPVDISLSDKKRIFVASKLLSTIYFIAAPDVGMVKIGKTNNLEQRFATLQNGCPVRLEVALTVQYTDALEHRIHRHLSEHRSHGEWFCAEKPVVEFMRNIRDKGTRWLVDEVDCPDLGWLNRRGGLNHYDVMDCTRKSDPDYRPNTQNSY